MRRPVHLGVLLLVLVVTFAASASFVSAQYGRATPRVPLPFIVTEATCQRFTIGVVQQDGAGYLTVVVNERIAHRQAGVHLGPPIQARWPRELLMAGENTFLVTAYVHSRLHVFDGKFNCPSGLGLATPVASPSPTLKTTPRNPIVGPPGKGFTPSPTAVVTSATPATVTPTIVPTGVPSAEGTPSPTIDPSTASPEAPGQQSPTPSGSPTPTAAVTGMSTASLGLDDPSPTSTPGPSTTEEPASPPPDGQPSPEPTPFDPGGPISSPGNPTPIDPPPDHPSPSPIPSPLDPRTPPPPASPPTPPVRVPDTMPPEVERFVDLIRGGGGYSEADRQQMAEQRKWLQAQVLDPSTSAVARQQYEAEIAASVKATGPQWPSPFVRIPLKTFQDAWAKRFGLLWLLVAILLIMIAWRLRRSIRRWLLSSQPDAGTSHVLSDRDWKRRRLPRRQSIRSTPAAPAIVVVDTEAAPGVSKARMQVNAAEHLLPQIVIPPKDAHRLEAIVTEGKPGVRIDGRSDREFALTTALRRAFFSILLAAGERRLRYSEIRPLLPGNPTYESGLPIWQEGARRKASKIYAHNIVRQDADGRWFLDLDGVPSTAP